MAFLPSSLSLLLPGYVIEVPLVQHLSHKWKQIRDCYYHLLWGGGPLQRLDLFWNLIEFSMRYSTAFRCTPCCEVELLRSVAHIWASESSLIMHLKNAEFSFLWVLLWIALSLWGDKHLDHLIKAAYSIFVKRIRVSSREKPPIPSAFFMSLSQYPLYYP